MDATQTRTYAPSSDEVIRSGALDETELDWRDLQPWLKTCGYQLRPRYQPDWVPSWKGNLPLLRNRPEDGYRLLRAAILDATRIEDGKRVALKRITKSVHPYEVGITQIFNNGSLLTDPQNHCVPVLDVLYPPNCSDETIIVLPFLQSITTPRFDTFGEVIDCLDQLFKGLQFIHRQNVAHRDISSENVMMEGDKLFPGSWHHIYTERAPNGRNLAKFFTRTQRPSKYYFIDFGLSRQYDPSNDNPLEPRIIGGDKTVPEFQTSAGLFNPFHTDICYLGNLVREYFTEGCSSSHIKGHYGMEFLQPLISDMVQDDPKKRPTIDEVVVRFEEIWKGLGSWKLRSRPRPKKEFIFKAIPHMCGHWMRRVGYVVRRVPPIPSKRVLCS
ncbi:hypothetical protein BDN72DRAFT_789669 [Pluteus cervinus]|uniref:Uncharacterized protein n=1 Tax=Pluteus cervinus TaxID=181527 RepID=A0ACD3B934_9AGAR|nr:hypothetical protein BDN72DRAFT_789669 [Pluteus cervinus]